MSEPKRYELAWTTWRNLPGDTREFRSGSELTKEETENLIWLWKRYDETGNGAYLLGAFSYCNGAPKIHLPEWVRIQLAKLDLNAPSIEAAFAVFAGGPPEDLRLFHERTSS